MNKKNIKVVYTSRSTQKGYTTVPKIQIEGKWLEDLGFSIGDTIAVEYQEGSITIRRFTAEEAAEQERKALEADIKKKKAEMKRLRKGLHSCIENYSKVAESNVSYSSR